MAQPDPFTDPETLIRRLYAYVAYRVGQGPDAEDVTSTALERALRYRHSYDPRRGEPIAWLIGIARTCVDDHRRSRSRAAREPCEADVVTDLGESTGFEESVVDRITIATAVATLDDRDRELIALRYGADLSTRRIGALLGMKPNAVDVALHRCRERLKHELGDDAKSRAPRTLRVGRPASQTRG